MLAENLPPELLTVSMTSTSVTTEAVGLLPQDEHEQPDLQGSLAALSAIFFISEPQKICIHTLSLSPPPPPPPILSSFTSVDVGVGKWSRHGVCSKKAAIARPVPFGLHNYLFLMLIYWLTGVTKNSVTHHVLVKKQLVYNNLSPCLSEETASLQQPLTMS